MKKEKHGESRTRLYKIWADMKARCSCIGSVSYIRYGARGIEVCEEWRNSYVAFRDWALNNGYTDDLTIERVNVDGNYEPDNCKFITWKDQYLNRRCNRDFIATSPDGLDYESNHIANFSKEHDLNSKMVSRVLHGHRKHHRGWSFKFKEE